MSTRTPFHSPVPEPVPAGRQHADRRGRRVCAPSPEPPAAPGDPGGAPGHRRAPREELPRRDALHRHFRAAANAVFVERRFTPSVRRHKTLLVTCPMPVATAPRRLAPHRFVFTRGGTLQPLEFTTDPTAIRAHARIANNERLHAEVAGIIAESGLSALSASGSSPRAVRRPGHQRLPRGDAIRRAPVGRPRPPAAPARAGPPDPHAVDVGHRGRARLRDDLPGLLQSPQDRASATAGTPRIATSARPDPREEAHRWRWIP